MNHTADNCIFCKIIDGQIPCSKVYEDEHVLAFLDISQVTKRTYSCYSKSSQTRHFCVNARNRITHFFCRSENRKRD